VAAPDAGCGPDTPPLSAPTPVSTDQVRHIAKLARIAMTDAEIERLAPDQ